MNLVKSPHQILLEQAGLSLDSIPGLANTPQQMMPQYAPGGSVQQNLSPADMQAAMIVSGQTPQHFAEGKHATSFLEKLKALFKHIPMPATANVAIGLPSAYGEHQALQENLQSGNYGSAANNAFQMGASISPYFLVPSIYNAGKEFSEAATGHLSHNPAYRQQMQNMSSAPLSGALSGDTGLASQIMGQHEYNEPPSILAGTKLIK
jgi:hypothetical protein